MTRLDNPACHTGKAKASAFAAFLGEIGSEKNEYAGMW
jgi:hypothetical protein